MKTETPLPSMPADSDFDLRVRAEMALAFEPSDPPPHLLRKSSPWLARRGVQRVVAGLVLAATGSGTVLAMRPPSLVRDAIEHESHERTLRGNAMDPQQMLARLGLGQTKVVPGFPQLMRVCDIEGHVAYHLTTYFEKGGMVTVFAFDQPVALKEDGGWWNGVHWRVIRSREGKPLLLVSSKQKGLSVAQFSLQGTAPPAPG
ncbi:hypothetical protein [Methylibium sp.]|uniref:hypothetical protein n=1 Tax=Methylibium sp. TaxID=2067992 RepID=UPI003D0DBE8A